MSLGENIYHLRTEKNMSQVDLADALEVSRQSVSKWENDMAVPELDKLIKMAALFEVTLDALVGNAPPQSAPAPALESPAVVVTGISTGDLVSVVLLIFGVVIPLTIVITSQMHNSIILWIIGLYIVPPMVTLGSAFCSPRSILLLRMYVVYNGLAGILNILTLGTLGIFLCLINLGILLFWISRL